MKTTYKKILGVLLVISLNTTILIQAVAGEAEVVDVTLDDQGGEKYRISVTLKHADTGWDHYANAWLVFDEDGNLLGERVLHHPHVNEQPFTRSLTVSIPAGVKNIIIKAKDSVHGLNDEGFEVTIPQ